MREKEQLTLFPLYLDDHGFWEFFYSQDIRSIEHETAELLKRRMRGDVDEDQIEVEGEQKVN